MNKKSEVISSSPRWRPRSMSKSRYFLQKYNDVLIG